MVGYILFAHGSTVAQANDAVRTAAARFARKGGHKLVEVAFLDCTPPDLVTSAGLLVEAGADRIVVIPYFLTLGVHAARDLPRMVREASRTHKNVQFHIVAPMDGHPAITQILEDRALTALGDDGAKPDEPARPNVQLEE